MTKNILALDPANRLGFAHGDGFRGVIELQRGGDLYPGDRLIRFENWLCEALDNHETKLIAAEDASFGAINPNTAASHNEIRGIIHLVAAESGIPVELFQPSTIKLHATGRGNADKAAMVRAAKRYFEIEVTSDDLADALWILDLASRPDCWPKPKPPKRKKRMPPPGRRLFS